VGKIRLDLDIEMSQIAPSVAGDVSKVGPTFVERKIVATALLEDGEAAIIAVNLDSRLIQSEAGTPYLSSIPVIGRFFTRTFERSEDVRMFISAQARRISSPAEFAADSIRRRLAFERRTAQGGALPQVALGEPAYAVLVTTRSRRQDADDISEGLVMRGFDTTIHPWTLEDAGGSEDLFDVYVTSLETMVDAAEVASTLNRDGWQTDLTLLPVRF
jgi:hypothetical protein